MDIIVEKEIKTFIKKRNNISTEKFLEKYILPIEKKFFKIKKENFSENHDNILLNIKIWNI